MGFGKTVLVIDDNQMALEGMASWLELNEYKVISAEDGQQGLALAREHLPDVIICDYRMPDMDGLDVLEAVRSDERIARIPFIMYTSHGSALLKTKCVLLGADACLDKAEGVDELLDTIRQVQKA